jgi:glycerol-1-phosphate dehydrogenase [NAD(P)+]
LGELSCNCGYDHAMPQMDIYIREGLIEDCAECIASAGLTGSVLVVADERTYRAAAGKVIERLSAAGRDVRLCMLPGDNIEPTPQMADLICAQAADADFLLSVGSGVVTDLTRRAAFLTDKPFAVFGTAASMDGYTSITSSMMIDGMKLTQYGQAARLLMFDTNVLASAPLPMQAAGVGDVLAKYNVLVDWKLGRAVTGEVFCPLCGELLEMAVERCASSVEEIALRTPRGMDALIESLIYAGLTVLVVGTTRSVASCEHNMAHYWDMAHLAWGGVCPSHGVSVGINLIYSLMMHDYLRKADWAVDLTGVKEQRTSREQRRQWYLDTYPAGVGEDVMKTNEDWYFGWTEQHRRIGALQAYREQYLKDSEILPDYRAIHAILGRFGVPNSATKAGIDASRMEKTLLCAGDYRKRYSIAEALRELGMLRGCVDHILSMESTL